MIDFQTRLQNVLFPEGIKHPNQAEPDALLNEVRRIMRDHDSWKQKYLMKITEPVKDA